jgi:hypothetical protein
LIGAVESSLSGNKRPRVVAALLLALWFVEVQVAAQREAEMEWLFIALLLAITILAWLQLDSLHRIQAMHVSLLEIALADSSKKNATELRSDLTEAIKRSSNATVSEISDFRDAICGRYQQVGLGRHHYPGALEEGFDKIVKGLASVEHAISLIESRR